MGLSSFTGRYHGYRPDPALSPERQQVLRVAYSHVGICEATNPAAVQRIRQATGNSGHSAWCASAQVSNFTEAGLAKFLPRGVNGAAASFFGKGHDIYEDGRWLGTATTSQPGDLFGYVYRGSPAVHHVGLQVGQWTPAATVYDVEGNYGGCEKLVLRPKRSIAIIAKYLPD